MSTLRRYRSATPPPAPATRRPGRPRRSSDPATRERLLDRAVLQFAERGVAATTLRDLALASGVTPAMVGYYFGNKTTLLDAVIAERLMPVFMALREPLSGDAPSMQQRLERFIDALFDAIEAHPWLPQLWVRDILTQGGALRGLLVDRIGPAIAHGLVAHFKAGRKRGEVCTDIDPQLLMLSVVGQTMFMAAALPLWREVFDNKASGLAALRRHAPLLLERGWRNP
jgi:AcrR family transcriptional regulator